MFLIAFLLLTLGQCNTARKTLQYHSPSTGVKAENPPDTIKNQIETLMKDKARTDPFLEKLLSGHPEHFDGILKNRKTLNVQVIYTQINRDRNNGPEFTDYYFNLDSSQYFYPASTVKMPTALLALQKLNELSLTGVTKSTTMITEAGYSGQSSTYNDPESADGRPTIENYIKKIFLVSDNEAFNRLYEFLGQEYLNEQLHKMGYTDAQILHRLEISLSEDENRHTNPINFLDSNNNVLFAQPMQYNETKYAARNDSLGQAHYRSGKFVEGAMDFSRKNRISLQDLHQVLRSIIFPNSVAPKQRFNIPNSDYHFVRKYMSEFPGESIYPPYDPPSYYDAYGKFLFYGSQKEPLPKNIRIFNKEGDAYGELLDIAYVVDFDKKIEFFLSAAINCNTNGIVNDDNYDYDNIGFPFMKNLGRVIYDYESERNRVNPPDLSEFKIDYDKK